MVEVRLIDDTSELEPFQEAIDQAKSNASRVAFDCEGVNLCRAGTIELVSLCFEEDTSIVYVVDTGRKSDSTLLQLRLEALKRLLESEEVTKIVHDCRMDCDALYHLFDIHLKNVHDTSCFECFTTGASRVARNATLRRHGIEINDVRDSSTYKTNPAFWATRPLTSRMVSWASQNVDTLLILAERQVAKYEARGDGYVERARDASMAATTLAAHMKIARNLRCKVGMGRFMGTKQRNLESLQKRTGTIVYMVSTYTGRTEWTVFYPSEQALQTVKRAMGY